MTEHFLDCLLTPKSVAIVGASDKPGSNGHAMMVMSHIDGYSGTVYPVNPRLKTLEGKTCYPTLATLPEVPEHVVIGVASRFVEDILDQAIALGVRAATIFASCHLADDTTPRLVQRITEKARAANMQICGANCMGFYVPSVGFRAASMPSPAGIRQGGIAWIAQSGSALGALSHNDRRLGFTLCVSTGMEMVTTVPDYMDWALDHPNTRVVGLFLESIRTPRRFIAALQKANDKGIPVVALKVGRTEKSAQMAVSHTGAIAGNDAAYEAVFRKFGVLRVADMDEMAATLALFDVPRRAATGALVTIHDSGGERELVVDLADDLEIPYAVISSATQSALQKDLEPGLKAENPLDAYGTSNDLVRRYSSLTANLMNDPNASLGLFMANPRDDYGYAQQYTEAVALAAGQTTKPIAMVSNYAMVDDRKLAQALLPAQVPLLRGTKNALIAAKNAMAYRDFQARPLARAGSPAPNLIDWQDRLSEGTVFAEQDGLRMLALAGMNIPKMHEVQDDASLDMALETIGFPIVMKTAEGHMHKSDVNGVVVNLKTKTEAKSAYHDMAARLGPRVLVMEMATPGPELAFGAINDATFGPVVIVSAGGKLIEYLDDSAAALAPFETGEARALIQELKCARFLAGVRGAPPANIDSAAEQLSQFSKLVAALGTSFREIDVNPIICGPKTAICVDCLVAG